MKPTLLIVDDDQGIRTQMKWALDPDYEIVSAEDRPGAIESFKVAHPAVTLLDLGLPPRPNESEEGLAALADLLAIDRAAKIIVISGQSEKKNAIQAVGAGAYDFLCKPIDVDELKLLLRRCVYVSDLEKGYRDMQQKLRADIFENMLGTSPQMQVKLLRFLQDQRFQRVGGRQEIQIDTRIVAATNADLKDAVAKGKFREDLYFRLAVVVIKLPPLRERAQDVELLARELLQQFAVQCDKGNLAFAPDALNAIRRHTWPGNVRELQNRVKRATIMAENRRVTANDLELLPHGSESVSRATLKEARESVERELVEQALKRHSGRVTPAASELGVSRPTLYELMDKLGIAKERASTNIN